MTTARGRGEDGHDVQCQQPCCAWDPASLRGKPANKCPSCARPIDDHGGRVPTSVVCARRWW